MSEYWSNVYGDTPLEERRAAYPCAYAFWELGRMRFGTDYPYGLETAENFNK
jgi:hypothetical protein